MIDADEMGTDEVGNPINKRNAWLETILCNDEASTDEELVEWFQKEGGLTEAEAREWVAKRQDYLLGFHAPSVVHKRKGPVSKRNVSFSVIVPFVDCPNCGDIEGLNLGPTGSRVLPRKCPKCHENVDEYGGWRVHGTDIARKGTGRATYKTIDEAIAFAKRYKSATAVTEDVYDSIVYPHGDSCWRVVWYKGEKGGVDNKKSKWVVGVESDPEFFSETDISELKPSNIPNLARKWKGKLITDLPSKVEYAAVQIMKECPRCGKTHTFDNSHEASHKCKCGKVIDSYSADGDTINEIIKVVLPLIKKVGGMAMDKWDSMSVSEREALLIKMSKSKLVMVSSPLAYVALKKPAVRAKIAKMRTGEMRQMAKDTGITDNYASDVPCVKCGMTVRRENARVTYPCHQVRSPEGKVSYPCKQQYWHNSCYVQDVKKRFGRLRRVAYSTDDVGYNIRYRTKCPICGMQLEVVTDRADHDNGLIWSEYEQHRLENHIDEMNDLADKAFPMGKVEEQRIDYNDNPIDHPLIGPKWGRIPVGFDAPKGSLIEEVIPTPSASVVIGGLALTAGLIAFLYFRKKKA